MKDFCDLWVIASELDLDGGNLSEAIRSNLLLSLDAVSGIHLIRPQCQFLGTRAKERTMVNLPEQKKDTRTFPLLLVDI